MKLPVLLSLVLLAALPAAAEFCDLDLRYENGEVRWKPIAGALRYTVLETYGGLKPPFFYSTTKSFVTVDHRATEAMTVRYIVTAEVEEGVRIQGNAATTWRDACTGTIDVPVPVDQEFRKFTRRAIVPVVGSTPGAFGGQFKTAVELRGALNEHGRIVFHPAGRVAADSDPSIPYSFANTRAIVHDDIVAAMGQSGIGSLEIIPNAESVDRIPEVSVRLYNDTSMGTFGTYSAPVLPYDYLSPAGMQVRGRGDHPPRGRPSRRTAHAALPGGMDGDEGGLRFHRRDAECRRSGHAVVQRLGGPVLYDHRERHE